MATMTHVTGSTAHSPALSPWAQQSPYKPVASSTHYPVAGGNDGHSSFPPPPQQVAPPVPEPPSNWRPGWARGAPWRGMATLLLALGCAAAAALLLRLSDGQPTAAWRFSPTVYLAILSTAANISLAFALATGVRVAWWVLAVRGAPLRDLHRSWQAGSSLWRALPGLARRSRVAFAVVAVALALANGPLLQRASVVVTRDVDTVVPVVANLAPALPAGYTSLTTGRSRGPIIMTDAFARIVQSYASRAPMQAAVEGTAPGGTYAMTVRAAALARVNCTTASQPLNYSQSTDPSRNGGAPVGQVWPAFAVDLGWRAGEGADAAGRRERIHLNVSRAVTAQCAGEYVTQSCRLVSAVAEYDIQLQGDTVRVLSSLANPRIVALSNVSNSTGIPGSPETIGGFALAGNDSYTANVTMYYTGVYFYQFQQLNTFAMGYVNDTDSRACQRTWRDPTDDIMAGLNEMAFRTSLSLPTVNTTANPLDPGLATRQPVDARQTATEPVFQTLYAPLVVAVALIAFAALAVLFIFAGWRTLGRALDLDPLETARAFGAPLLRGPPADADLKELVRRVGHHVIRYEKGLAPGAPRELREIGAGGDGKGAPVAEGYYGA